MAEYNCMYCNKTFKYSYNKNKHQKTCKFKDTITGQEKLHGLLHDNSSKK